MAKPIATDHLDTFPKWIAHHAQVRPMHTAMRFKDMGIWREWTWEQVFDIVRAYAIGLGAATQVFTGIVEFLVVGRPDAFSHALSMGAGWLLNLAVAEWLIRRRSTRRSHTGPVVVSPSTK